MHINDDKFHYNIEYKEKWYPRYYSKYYTEAIGLSMHSPDELPQYNPNNFIKLHMAEINQITYNRIKMKLLGPKFDTNCKNYSIDSKNQENKMRANCLKYCVKKGLDEKFIKLNYTNSIFYKTRNLWTKDEVYQYKDHKVCPFDFLQCSPDQTLVRRCETECRLKCINRYYNYDNNLDKLYGNFYSINMGHNQLPDQITEHMPETTSIEFISNFGGLMGMWLGLSALAILKFLIQLMHKVKRLDSVKQV